MKVATERTRIMDRRNALKLLTAMTLTSLTQFSPEQARAQTEDEVGRLLREAFGRDDGAYAGSVLRFPREVGAELGVPVSDDTVALLRSINEGIEPRLLPPWADPLPSEVGSAEPSPFLPDENAIDYFSAILDADEFDPLWYQDAETKAAALGVTISTETASALQDLGNVTVSAQDANTAPDTLAVNPVIVAAIVVVIVFGPRAQAVATDGISSEERLIYPPIVPPVIDPSWIEKF